jgi:hypothetical protein
MAGHGGKNVKSAFSRGQFIFLFAVGIPLFFVLAKLS